MLIHSRTVSSDSRVSRESYYNSLPPEIREQIAAKLAARDLIAVSEVSRHWRQAAAANWQAAYGPGPCHRAANAPAQWRAAVQEKVHIENRLLAPFGKTGPTSEQLEKQALRLRKNAPVAALMALRLANSDDARVWSIVLDQLWAQTREEELLAYAETRLQQGPNGARELLRWAYEHYHLPVLRLAQRAGAQRHGHYFSPTVAANNDRLDVLRYMREEEPKCASRHAWYVALTSALRTSRLDTAREVVACLQAGVGMVEHSLPCHEGLDLDLGDLPDDTLDATIDLLAAAGMPLLGILTATMGGPPERALFALRRLRAVAYTDARWHADLQTSIWASLGWCKQPDLPIRLRAYFALGGRFEDIAVGISATFWSDAMDLANIVAAGVPPDAHIADVPLVTKVLTLLRYEPKTAENALTILAAHGAQLPENEMETATEMLNRSCLSGSLLRAFLEMGYPTDSAAMHSEWVYTHKLDARRAPDEAEAELSRYDDAFFTGPTMA